ncbi:hypothetical protein ElyMa_004728300 [Elysia marginata]|uniref:Uncharacterized protein n=1 Tax=Elysia marginata TaxID=1093978 RepID=A0AAV4IGM4_9GAST|nr:hypothetical protein ElyMa_004728300 [Elysia marginata]
MAAEPRSGVNRRPTARHGALLISRTKTAGLIPGVATAAVAVEEVIVAAATASAAAVVVVVVIVVKIIAV